jgi:hypothetical protein
MFEMFTFSPGYPWMAGIAVTSVNIATIAITIDSRKEKSIIITSMTPPLMDGGRVRVSEASTCLIPLTRAFSRERL